MMKLLFALLVLRSTAVINGKPAKNTPWVIWAGGCGGSILSEDIVLTAAHCASAFRVGKSVSANVMKQKQTKAPAQKSSIKKVVKHPSYKSLTNDIAVVKLAKPLDLSLDDGPKAADLPFAANAVADNVMMAGFGVYQFPMGGTSQDLLEHDAAVIECSSTSYRGAGKGETCVKGKDNTRGCNGDSGSGIIRRECGRNFVIGTVSYGTPKCNPKDPYVISHVHAHLDFIKKTWEAMSPGTYRAPKECGATSPETPGTPTGAPDTPTSAPGTPTGAPGAPTGAPGGTPDTPTDPGENDSSGSLPTWVIVCIVFGGLLVAVIAIFSCSSSSPVPIAENREPRRRTPTKHRRSRQSRSRRSTTSQRTRRRG